MAYIDDIGNHYNNDTTELIQVNSKLKYYSVPKTVRTIKEFAFLNSRLEVIIFNGQVESIEGIYGLRVYEVYVPLGLKEHYVSVFKNENVRDFIKEIEFEKVDLYYKIGVSLLNGDKVSIDVPKALEYLDFCAKNLDVRAIYLLAQHYENQQQYIKAYNRYLKASKFLYKDAAFKTESLKMLAEQEQKRNDEQKKRGEPHYLFFDTETTGLPPKGMYDASPTKTDIWPRLVQIAWIVTDKEGKILKRRSEIIYPDGFAIPQEATNIHGITTERARREGKSLHEVLGDFAKDLSNVQRIVCHNVEFDQHIVGAELYRMNMDYDALMNKPSTCTMLSSTNFCAIPNPNGYNDYKWPKLPELYRKLFGHEFSDAHDALADVSATKECYFELKRRGIIQ